MTQLLLPLYSPPLFTFGNIVVHEGIEKAVSTVRSVYGSGDRPFPYLFIHGPHGTGKTHILKAIVCLLKQRTDLGAGIVKFLTPEGDPPRFENLKDLAFADEMTGYEIRGLVIDDLHVLGQDDTLHLWNLANKLTRSGAPLIMSSLHSPEEVFFNNPHLKSRVTSGLVFILEVPDDSIRTLILDKMAKDRNVRLPHEVANYLVTRKSRNVKELERLMEILDNESLRLKKRITLSLVKYVEQEGLL
ncbi:MAG: DnaA/Hda family protein [Deltaproteobacteria bacterium]|nr:DnaA/Hda family protein [Deltaproteobacteria bacterium]